MPYYFGDLKGDPNLENYPDCPIQVMESRKRGTRIWVVEFRIEGAVLRSEYLNDNIQYSLSIVMLNSRPYNPVPWGLSSPELDTLTELRRTS